MSQSFFFKGRLQARLTISEFMQMDCVLLHFCRLFFPRSLSQFPSLRALCALYFLSVSPSKPENTTTDAQTASAGGAVNWKIILCPCFRPGALPDWNEQMNDSYKRRVSALQRKQSFTEHGQGQNHTMRHLCCADARGYFLHIFLRLFFSSTGGLLNWFIIWTTIRFLFVPHRVIRPSIPFTSLLPFFMPGNNSLHPASFSKPQKRYAMCECFLINYSCGAYHSVHGCTLLIFQDTHAVLL